MVISINADQMNPHPTLPVLLDACEPSSWLPDLLTPPVRILRRVGADRLPDRDALLDLDDLRGWDEHRCLVHIVHVDHYSGGRGWELHHKGSLVGHFDVQNVLVFGLEVQALRDKEEDLSHQCLRMQCCDVRNKGPTARGWRLPASTMPSFPGRLGGAVC